MPLDELLKKFSKALDYYKNGRVYKRIFGTAVALVTQKIKTKKPLAKVTQGEFARLGTVRSLEVTHGINGWHPHVHEVLFMDNYDLIGDKGARARDELTKAWVASLLKAGLGDNSKLNDMLNIAWDIRGGDYVSDYINKFGREPLNINGWTISHEVTKANSKSGRVAKMKIGNEYHYTPFQLLNYSLEGDKQAGQLFKEFSAAFEGKRMNYWTNGLKDWFGLHDKDDADLAEEPDTEQITEDFVLRLSTDEWSLILKTNTRWECLNAAARYGEAGVKDFLEGLTLRPVTHSGDFRDRARPNPDLFFH